MQQTVIEIKLDGNFQHDGFRVSMQARLDSRENGKGGIPPVLGEALGQLTASAELQQALDTWQNTYRRLGDKTSRIMPREVIYGGSINPIDDCQLAARRLKESFLRWLSHPSFLPVDRTIRELLQRQYPIQLMICCSDRLIQLLPWHCWDIVDRYPNLEIGFSVAATAVTIHPISTKTDVLEKVRILAILGHSEGINVAQDRQILEALPDAHVDFLVEPTRQQVNDLLWTQPWDMLFFAGHSQSIETQGRIFINPSDSLTMDDLRYSIRRAISNGLQLAIFNSCDGLGIAQELEALQLPQMIVMRQPVPDAVAQAFLRYFLDAFFQGESLYQAERLARERLQSMEQNCPCATWLPVVVQKPNAKTLVWSKPDDAVGRLTATASSSSHTQPKHRLPIGRSLPATIAISFIATSLVMGLRLLGLLQPFEFWLYDRMLSWRPLEASDERIILITLDAEDLTYQDTQGMSGRSSLSNEALEQILLKLQPHQPSVIGLDIYRDQRTSSNQQRLNSLLQTTENLVVICAVESSGIEAIAPPPEVPLTQVGFSNIPVDPDGVIRRQLFGMAGDTDGCTTDQSLSFRIATQYLNTYDFEVQRPAGQDLSINDILLPKLTLHTSIYHTVDLRGYSVLLNYRNVDEPEDIAYETIPLRELLDGEWDEQLSELMQDRIILIGNISKSYNDYHLTPMGEIAGIYLQAQMVSHLVSVVLDDRPLLRSLSQPVDAAWVWGWALMSGVLAYRLRSRLWLSGLAAGQIVLLGGTGWVLFLGGIVIPIIPGLIVIGITIRGVTLLDAHSESQHKP